jgi:hypothetical protein
VEQSRYFRVRIQPKTYLGRPVPVWGWTCNVYTYTYLHDSLMVEEVWAHNADSTEEVAQELVGDVLLGGP